MELLPTQAMPYLLRSSSCCRAACCSAASCSAPPCCSGASDQTRAKGCTAIYPTDHLLTTGLFRTPLLHSAICVNMYL